MTNTNPNAHLDAIDFYWRPGCPFCSGLESKLAKMGIPMAKHNIWDNPADAAVVRSIADGNETVPTLVIGDAKMVNPSPAQVVQAMTNQTPHLLPEGIDVPEPGKAGRMINRLLGG